MFVGVGLADSFVGWECCYFGTQFGGVLMRGFLCLSYGCLVFTVKFGWWFADDACVFVCFEHYVSGLIGVVVFFGLCCFALAGLICLLLVYVMQVLLRASCLDV